MNIFIITAALVSLLVVYEFVVVCIAHYYAYYSSKCVYYKNGVWTATKKGNSNYSTCNTTVRRELISQLSTLAHPLMSWGAIGGFPSGRKFKVFRAYAVAAMTAAAMYFMANLDSLQAIAYFVSFCSAYNLGYLVGCNKVKFGQSIKTVREEVELINKMYARDQFVSNFKYAVNT